MSLTGTQVGHIRILETLGEGGMGEVYVGFDETLHRKVALKAIRGDHRLRPQAKARFLREARILSQLEHPNICRIYDYLEHEDAELLVLELIEGETLAQAIKRGLGWQRKLEIAIRVAGVLEAAHAEGIVHRDLKPDNVMIATDGSVKVLDFGLARAAVVAPDEHDEPVDSDAPGVEPHSMDTAALDATLPAASGGATFFRTAAGSIMGTPLYMSPEQAQGQPVTTASDMYSFGLLLQALFTEQPPYDLAVDSATLLAKATAGETLPVTGLGADLAGLIGRLKARAPAARATALEALQRLEWIRDKPKRRARRLVTAAVLVVAALGGVKYTLDLRRERAVADQRREQAEELIGFMLGDLRKKLEPVGRLEILDDVGSKALEYFASVPESELSDVELARRAMALYQIGDVRTQQGNLAAAMEAFQEALTLGKGLVARDPENLEWLETLGNCHFWVGSAHWERGELDQALERFRDYRAIGQTLALKDPTNLDWQMEHGFGESNIGSVLEAQGNLDGALGHFEKALSIVESVVAAEPDRTDRVLELAGCQLLTGRTKEALGRLADALKHYRADLAILRDLVERQPENTEWLERLATSHSYVGTMLERLGQPREALEHHRAYRTIVQELVETDDSNMWWQDMLAKGLRNLGRMAAWGGDPQEGLALLRQSFAIHRELASKDPDRRGWQLDQALGRFEIGRALMTLGDLPGALAEAEQARVPLETLSEKEPSNAIVHRFLGECHLLRGQALEAMGRSDEAAAARVSAHEAIAPLARDSRDGTLLATFARALRSLEREQEARAVIDRLRSQGFVDPRIPELSP